MNHSIRKDTVYAASLIAMATAIHPKAKPKNITVKSRFDLYHGETGLKKGGS
jgi:hypothetical protein